MESKLINSRREFLRKSTALCATSIVAPSILSGCAGIPESISTKQHIPSWKLGWKSVESDTLNPLKMSVRGKIPKALHGAFYRNGPAKYQRAGEHYQHWFDGDGMVQKYQISEKGIAHSGKFIHTEKYLAEEQAEQFLHSGAGTVFPEKMPARNNDTFNTANTSLIYWNEEMLALWEGGSAYRLDADSLHTQGLKTWAPELQHMPFSAHPKVDNSGKFLWNFGLIPYHGNKGSLIVYKLQTGSNNVDYQLVPLPFAGYVHDFAQTGSKLIFYISPYHYSHEHGSTYVKRFKWQPELGGKVVVVDKSDLSKHKLYDAPPGFVFHFGQAWETGTDINVVCSWHHTPEIMANGMYQMLNAEQVSYAKSRAAVLTLNLQTGRFEMSESRTELEFPGFDQAKHGMTVFGIGRKPGSAHHYANSTLAWHAQTGEQDEYFFDDGIIAEEPLFIADRSKSKVNAGWLLQTALNYKKARTEIYVFDALSISSGPVARATMDRATPLGFHGTFVQ